MARVRNRCAHAPFLLTSCGNTLVPKPAPVFGGRSIQEDQEWPQELMGGDGSTVLIYQPQVESWKSYKLLRARMAVAFRRMRSASPVLGAVVLEGDTSTSNETGQVRISNIRIVDGRFPASRPPTRIDFECAAERRARRRDRRG
jgi:hypothetical protein